MRPARFQLPCPWLAALAALCVGNGAWAQQSRQQTEVIQPRWLRLEIRDATASFAAEGEHSTIHSKNSGTGSTFDRLFLGPSLGLNFDGSIYHPNLIHFSVESENIFGWQTEHITLPGGSRTRDEMQYLGRVTGGTQIFPGKPLHGACVGNYSHDYRDYDVFNRAIVDHMSLGGRVAWDQHPLSLGVGYLYHNEDINTLSGLSSSRDNTFSLNAAHTRESGQTSFGGTYSDYSHVDYGSAGRGSSYALSLADSEVFGSRQQVRLESALNYFRQDYFRQDAGRQPNDQLTAQANLKIDHQPKLTTQYGLSFNRYKTSATTSDNIAGQAQVQHRLFDSLTSTLLLQGSSYENTTSSGSGSTRRFGFGWTEHYTKSLGESTRITLHNSLRGDRVAQRTTSTIQNEQHTFGSGGAPPDAFFLNVPNVKENSVRLWKLDRSQQYLLGIDYELFVNGTLTGVRRLKDSIKNATVSVDYDVDPLPGGEYDTMADSFGVRLSLWKNQWGLYFRGSLAWNNAPAEMRLPGMANYAFGTDYTWRWLRAGAEYNIYDSGYARYNMTRVFESFNHRFGEGTTVGLDLSQSWLDYLSSQRQEQDYRFTAFAHRRLTRHLFVNTRGGYDLRRGRGVDREMLAFRFDLDYRIGRTTVKMAYDYEHDLFLKTEVRERHLFSVNLQRTF